jgi:hypothetical protein
VTKIRGTDDDDVNRQAEKTRMTATSWTLEEEPGPGPSSSRPPARPSWAQLQLTFEGCDFNYIMAMRLWSLAGTMDGPFFVGTRVGGFLGSLVPIATWLNPHSTTGLAIEVSKFFNIQFFGRQFLISRYVAMGMSVEDAYRVQGTD